MRAIWSGSVSFGLVNIPVKLYSAAKERAVSFHMLDRRDMHPISYLKVGRNERVVDPKDIVKGFEYEKGKYVIMDDDDFKRAAAKKSDQIDILQFVDEGDIEKRLYAHSYFVEPDKKAGKAYVLLRDALKKSGKVGIGRFVMHDREHIAALRVQGKGIMLDELRFQDELRDADDIKLPARADYSKKEFDLALSLISHLSERFDPSEYKDTYADELKRIVKAKAKGDLKSVATTETSTSSSTDVSDILEMLRKSLDKEGAHTHSR